MLRINLLQDAQPVVVAEEPSRAIFAWFAGALAIVLCALLAAAGYVLQTDQLTQLQSRADTLAAQPPQSAPAPIVEDAPLPTIAIDENAAVLSQIERNAAAAQRRVQRSALAPAALQTLAEALRLHDARGRVWEVREFDFDGERFLIEGQAKSAEELSSLLERLEKERALANPRFTELRVAVDPEEQEKAAGRRTLNAPVDFKLYATLALEHEGGN